MPLDEEQRNLIVTLSARGWSQREIASEVHVSRKAVRTALEAIAQQRAGGHTALPEPKAKRASSLDAHEVFLQKKLDEFPDITAVRLQEELRKEGFIGGYTILKERLRTLRPKPKKAGQSHHLRGSKQRLE